MAEERDQGRDGAPGRSSRNAWSASSHALADDRQAIRRRPAPASPIRASPIGVFLMAGTSGVGKTETALAVADLLYGGEQNLTTINMSEFKEEHKVSTADGQRRPATSASAKAACSPKRCAGGPISVSCSTRWRRRIPASTTCSTRSSTRAT
jgi:hypothetical protein